MLHTLRFSLQNAIYFIILIFFVSVLFTFYIQSVLKFKCKTPVSKAQDTSSHFFLNWKMRTFSSLWQSLIFFKE
jgi:hypothetical protein